MAAMTTTASTIQIQLDEPEDPEWVAGAAVVVVVVVVGVAALWTGFTRPANAAIVLAGIGAAIHVSLGTLANPRLCAGIPTHA